MPQTLVYRLHAIRSWGFVVTRGESAIVARQVCSPRGGRASIGTVGKVRRMTQHEASSEATTTEHPGTSHAQQAPGGGTSRGPDFGTGGQPQVPVPPYEGLGEGSAQGADGVRKAFDASNAPKPGPAPVVSDTERDGVTGTEMEPEPALGVGKSSSTGAQEQAPDRDDVATQGGTQRPAGKVAGDDSSDQSGPAGPK